MLSYILLVIGFALLLKGGAVLVDGASSLARRFGLSDLVIGLTVVSIGSSSPELIVNLLASFRGNADLAVGNVLGSNTVNILLGLGLAALIHNLKVRSTTVWKEIPFSLLAILVLAVLANDALIDGQAFSTVTRADGFVLLAFFSIFLYYIYSLSKKSSVERTLSGESSVAKSLLMVAGGGLCLTLGGKWVVDGALEIGRALGASDALMGLTVVAIGTSLPEIVTSAVAASRKKADIAIGNVVGSNIFNIFWVLGLVSLIRPVAFSAPLNLDILALILATSLLFVFLFVGREHTLSRWEGLGFIAIYVLYAAYLIYRG